MISYKSSLATTYDTSFFMIHKVSIFTIRFFCSMHRDIDCNSIHIACVRILLSSSHININTCIRDTCAVSFIQLIPYLNTTFFLLTCALNFWNGIILSVSGSGRGISGLANSVNPNQIAPIWVQHEKN